jgi:hypothetical protein
MSGATTAIGAAADELTRQLLAASPRTRRGIVIDRVTDAAAAGRTGARYRIRKEGDELGFAGYEALGEIGQPARTVDPDLYGQVSVVITSFEYNQTDGLWELRFGLDAEGRMSYRGVQKLEPTVSTGEDDLVEIDHEGMWRQWHGQAMIELKDGTILIAGVFGQEVILWIVLGGVTGLFVRALELIAGRLAYPLIRKAIADGVGAHLLRAFRRAPGTDQEALALLMREMNAGRRSFSSDLRRRFRAAFDFVEEYLRTNPRPPMPRAVKPNVANEALRAFSARSIRFDQQRVLITPDRMYHYLTRHHPDYFIGETTPIQTFFDRRMTIDTIVETIETALRQNTDKVVAAGTGKAGLIARVGEVDYVIAIQGQRVMQFYPAP